MRIKRLSIAAWCAIAVISGGSPAFAGEVLDRGVIAFPAADGGVYIGWRLMSYDPVDIGFDVYRAESRDGNWTKVNPVPITDSTNYVDRTAPDTGTFYSVHTLIEGRHDIPSRPVAVGDRVEIGGVVRIRLQGGRDAAKVAFADLDGDGELDYVVRVPDFNSDPYFRIAGPLAGTQGYWKKSPESVKLEAYRHDGTFLWRHDLGWGVESGVWFAPYIAYDLDGDGRAEVYCKGGPTGDPRDPDGRVTTGPEYLLKLDGLTGRVLARLDWPSRDGIERRPENPYAGPYSYYSRNLMGIAYLDGKRPHLIGQRGKYTQIKLRAYGPELDLVWKLDIDDRHYPTFQGAGAHGMHVADIDNDGRDEIVIGAAAIDDDGTPLWTTQRGHPDVCYVGDFDPSNPGMEIFYGHEWAKEANGVCMVDARTGRTLWGYDGPTTHLHSNGLVADIDPTRPGMECYAGEANGSQFWLYDAQGNRLGNRSLGGLAPRAVWWEDTPTKVIVSGGRMFKLKPPANDAVTGGALLSEESKGRSSQPWPGYVDETIGPVEGKIIAVGDILGDWREEFVVSVNGELRIHSTTVPAESRRITYLQDRKYRTSIASQSMGYLFPPIPGNDPSP